MAEETKVEVQSASNPEVAEDKKSNKTFTQSDFDSRLADEQKKITDKYADYDTQKTQLAELLEEKKKRDEAEMSEVEKLTATNEELVKKQADLESLLSKSNSLILRNDVLGGNDYQTLPKIYRDSVTGETVESITENANKILEQYKVDTANFGKSSNDGVPPNINNSDSQKQDMPTTLNEKIRLATANRFK